MKLYVPSAPYLAVVSHDDLIALIRTYLSKSVMESSHLKRQQKSTYLIDEFYGDHPAIGKDHPEGVYLCRDENSNRLRTYLYMVLNNARFLINLKTYQIVWSRTRVPPTPGEALTYWRSSDPGEFVFRLDLTTLHLRLDLLFGPRPDEQNLLEYNTLLTAARKIRTAHDEVVEYQRHVQTITGIVQSPLKFPTNITEERLIAHGIFLKNRSRDLRSLVESLKAKSIKDESVQAIDDSIADIHLLIEK